jgi:hypothetical protein
VATIKIVDEVCVTKTHKRLIRLARTGWLNHGDIRPLSISHQEVEAFGILLHAVLIS